MSIVEVGEKDPASEKNVQAVNGDGDGWCWTFFRTVAGVERGFAYRTLTAWSESLAVGCAVGGHGIGTTFSLLTH